jgi:hypothetical protein
VLHAALSLPYRSGYVRSLNTGVTVGPAPGKRGTWGQPEPGDRLTYNGKLSGNRYSELKQIHAGNVGRLRLKWIFPIPYYGLEVTPFCAIDNKWRAFDLGPSCIAVPRL